MKPVAIAREANRGVAAKIIGRCRVVLDVPRHEMPIDIGVVEKKNGVVGTSPHVGKITIGGNGHERVVSDASDPSIDGARASGTVGSTKRGARQAVMCPVGWHGHGIGRKADIAWQRVRRVPYAAEPTVGHGVHSGVNARIPAERKEGGGEDINNMILIFLIVVLVRKEEDEEEEHKEEEEWSLKRELQSCVYQSKNMGGSKHRFQAWV
jgi:hypothetical protein